MSATAGRIDLIDARQVVHGAVRDALDVASAVVRQGGQPETLSFIAELLVADHLMGLIEDRDGDDAAAVFLSALQDRVKARRLEREQLPMLIRDDADLVTYRALLQ